MLLFIEKEVKQMSKFTLFRTVCRIAGILSCVSALIGLNLHSTVLVLISVAVLAADLILIAWKNRCPFCKRALRIAPIQYEEYCPYCGSRIN